MKLSGPPIREARRRDLCLPLNDLSHDARAWAFNQAYLIAGVDLLGRAWPRSSLRGLPNAAPGQTLRTAIGASLPVPASVQPPCNSATAPAIPYVPNDARG